MSGHRSLSRISLSLLGLVALATASLFALGACSSTPPAGLGVQLGQLSPCPDSPNCVTSFAVDADHHVDPIPFSGDAVAARARLVEVLRETPRVRVVVEDGDYLRAEFTSTVFRFVDDVEFLIDPAAKCIHVRSASRVGHSDFGANRDRVAQLRAAFAGE